MLKMFLVAGLAASLLAGVGVVTLRTLGEDAKATFDTLNETFANSAPSKKKASAPDVADWIERYRAEASGARCRKTKKSWDYVCVFKDAQGRRVKMGVMVDSRQPIQMSPVVKLRRPLPSPQRT
jgi:hypothetical protein